MIKLKRNWIPMQRIREIVERRVSKKRSITGIWFPLLIISQTNSIRRGIHRLISVLFDYGCFCVLYNMGRASLFTTRTPSPLGCYANSCMKNVLNCSYLHLNFFILNQNDSIVRDFFLTFKFSFASKNKCIDAVCI